MAGRESNETRPACPRLRRPRHVATTAVSPDRRPALSRGAPNPGGSATVATNRRTWTRAPGRWASTRRPTVGLTRVAIGARIARHARSGRAGLGEEVGEDGVVELARDVALEAADDLGLDIYRNF